MVEEIAQLVVDVRDRGGHDPHRGEQQRRKGRGFMTIIIGDHRGGGEGLRLIWGALSQG